MTETTETEIMSASGCPVSHTDYTIQRPLFETYGLLNAERERGPFLWNDSRPRPFWMITDYEHVLEALQMPDVFSNEVINALAPEHTFEARADHRGHRVAQADPRLRARHDRTALRARPAALHQPASAALGYTAPGNREPMSATQTRDS